MEAERMIDDETGDVSIQAICPSIGAHGIGLWFSQAAKCASGSSAARDVTGVAI
jgi:hypothetical protein